MKYILMICLAVSAFLEIGTAQTKNMNSSDSLSNKKYLPKNDTTYLFTGNNLDKFQFVLEKSNNSEKNKYDIEKEAVHFNGNQIGYFRTREIYSNYNLHMEWRWPNENEKGNSGVLIHTQLPDTVWPACIQVQLKNGRAGDLITMNGAKIKETIGKTKDTAEMMGESSENSDGKWNNCDVICKDNSIIVYINHQMKNMASDSNFKRGSLVFSWKGNQ